MSWSQGVNAVGLLLDILGVWLLVFYVMPERGPEPESVWASDWSPAEEQKWLKQQKWGARIGLGSLTIGFLLQILASFL